ncbi:Bublin coiled-coil protein, partial [Lemmus lemmus]
GSGRAWVHRRIPPFRPGVPSAACTFRPASAFRATVAKFHFRVASAVPEPAMSGPNGDLSMPVDAGEEGENDSFGEAGVCCHQLYVGSDQLLSGSPGGEERPPPCPPPGAAGV